MKKLFLLLILSFFTAQSLAASCPDGNEPVKSISDDGTYFVYKCGISVLDAPKAEFYQRQYDIDSKVDQILSNRKTINPFLAWNYRKAPSNYYGIAWTGGNDQRLFPGNMFEFYESYWNYYYVGKTHSNWKDHAKQETFVTNIDWDHDAEYGVTKAMNIIDPAYPEAFADEVHAVSKDGFHGLFLDWWHIHHPIPWRGTRLENAIIGMTDEIRRKVGDDFLILGNTSWRKNSNLVSSINGVFLELYKEPYSRSDSFSFTEIAEMEEVIKFHEKHLRYPKLIAFEPWRITDKSDPTNRTSEDNLRFARLYSAMATVIPEHGYILYADNNPDFDDGDHDHYYYDVYSVDLGKPVSKYTPITQGVAYKKFEDGYIAFNRLGNDVTVNFGDFEVVIPSMDAVFLNEDGTIYVGCEEGFIKKDGFCMEDDSPIFSEDFENASQRVIQVNDQNNKWYIAQESDGNSVYCNKVNDDWSEFNFGSEKWSDYSISYRIKFSGGKGGRLETHIRKTNDSDYRAIINNVTGQVNIEFGSEDTITSGSAWSTKVDEWLDMQLIASGNNISYIVNGKVVAGAKDSRIKTGEGMIAVNANSEVCIDNIIVQKETTKLGEAMDENLKGVLFGSSADGSILLSEDFENLDQRDLLTDDRDDTWHVKQDSDGNSMYCNKKVTTDDYAGFNLGSENWRDYSMSYRMKFTTDKGGELETHIRKNSNRQGEYRSVINSVTGNTYLKYVKGADGINKKIAYGTRAAIRDKWADIQLIATGNYIEFHVNGKVVSYTEDDRLEKGAAMFAVTSHSELCIDDIVVKKETPKVESSQ